MNRLDQFYYFLFTLERVFKWSEYDSFIKNEKQKLFEGVNVFYRTQLEERKTEKTRGIITFTPFSNPVTTLTPTNFIHTLVQIGKQNNKKLILQIDKFWTHCFSSWKYVVKWATLARISTLCVHVFFSCFFCTCLELTYFKTWNCVQFAIDWTKTCFVLNFFFLLFTYDVVHLHLSSDHNLH